MPDLVKNYEMARRKRSRWKMKRKQICFTVVGVMAFLSVALSIASTTILESRRSVSGEKQRWNTRVAFGSGTSVDYRPQPVWVHGVIPSNPDAWIWLGDMAYLDKPRINCDALPWHQQCNCSNSWLHEAHHSCMAGNIDFASSRAEVQLSNPDYAQFLAFMCPGHRAMGLHPPTGSDPSVCPRQILGTYDDHDYGWGHGNKRLPQKDELKQIFLDAIGEPSSSARRSLGRGIEWKYTLNEKKSGQEIDIYLLDERYYRDTLPCGMRRSFCEKVALADLHHPKHAWCLDFLKGGESGDGSCCKKDDQIFYGWCLQSSNKAHPLWDNMCNPKSPKFGQNDTSHDKSVEAMELSESEEDDGSFFCEVLGKSQRKWFEEMILMSEAPLKIVVSSSVLIGNPIKKTCEDLGSITGELECPCFGDDWECYKPAQLHLLNLLSRAYGCVVVLTGDFQYSDIKVIRQGDQQHKHYGNIDFPYPLYQVMASGLTMNTGMNFSCDVLRQDPLGLRDHAECDFVQAPSFGMIEVEWLRDPVANLQIRDGMTGTVKLESSVKFSSCSQKQRTRRLKQMPVI